MSLSKQLDQILKDFEDEYETSRLKDNFAERQEKKREETIMRINALYNNIVECPYHTEGQRCNAPILFCGKNPCMLPPSML